MASTTKLMTALVALHLSGNRTDIPMIVPPQVKSAYGELLYLRPGDQYTFMQLLEGMLLPSANDAAVAIAVDSAGTLSRFVSLMNARARMMGLVDTHFANPSGLEDPDHYSSADDLARLGLAAMQNPVIRGVVEHRDATIPWPGHGDGTRVIGNINALLSMFPGATGVKTGYTSEAMNVIVGSASRNGHSVIAVLMGEPPGTLWSDEESLLTFGLDMEAAGASLAVPTTVAPRTSSRVATSNSGPTTTESTASVQATLVPPNRLPARHGLTPAFPSAAGAGRPQPGGGLIRQAVGWVAVLLAAALGLIWVRLRDTRMRANRALGRLARSSASGVPPGSV